MTNTVAEGRGVKVGAAGWKKREGEGGCGMEGEMGEAAQGVVILPPSGILRDTEFWDHQICTKASKICTKAPARKFDNNVVFNV